MKKSTKLFISALFLSVMSLSAFQAKAHCEIPCGIYGDSIRISLIYEHIETVEKSMNMINELSVQEDPNYNQLVRWVVNKEEHAQKIQDIVSNYFYTSELNRLIHPTRKLMQNTRSNWKCCTTFRFLQ